MWTELYTPADRLRQVRAASNQDGRLEVFGVGPDDRIWQTWQVAPNGGWSGGWGELYSSADRLRDVRVASNQDGRLEVFGTGPDDRIWHTWQVAPNGGWNGGWEELYSSADRLRSLDIGRNQDGRLEVFGVGPDNRIWHTWQVAPNGGWSGGWDELYGPNDRLREVRVASNLDGRLEVFGVGPDDRIWETWQIAPNGGWNGEWRELYTSADRIRSLDVGRNQDGRLEVVGVGPDDRIWRTGGWLRSSFQGDVFMWISHSVPSIAERKSAALRLYVTFVEQDQSVSVDSFPPIVVGPYNTPAGENRTTITRIGGPAGTYDPGTGQLILPLELLFDHSLSELVGAGDSKVTFQLTTGTAAGIDDLGERTGRAVNRTTGDLNLVGNSRFRGGFLGGRAVQVSIDGRLSPIP